MFCDFCLFYHHLLGVNDPAGNGFFCEFQFRFWRKVEYVPFSQGMRVRFKMLLAYKSAANL
jgi:hypothetical protein